MADHKFFVYRGSQSLEIYIVQALSLKMQKSFLIFGVHYKIVKKYQPHLAEIKEV